MTDEDAEKAWAEYAVGGEHGGTEPVTYRGAFMAGRESLRSRIAALEAVIEKVREAARENAADGELFYSTWHVDRALALDTSTVLDQMIREAKAEALEDLANAAWVENMEPFYDPHSEGRVSVYYMINERAAAYRNGDA